MKIYARAFIRYFIFYALSFAAFSVLRMILGNIVSLISLYYPNVLPDINEISEPEKYERFEQLLSFITGMLTLLLPAYISIAYDNERFEYIISKTDGFYKISEGAKLYFPKYFLPDTIASIIAPIPIFALKFIPIPNERRRIIKLIGDTLDSFLSFSNSFTNYLGEIFGIALLILIPIILKLIFAYPALKRWRAIWLSNIN